jgi:hypothetical protein
MRDFTKIAEKTDSFYRLATLVGDMATRIMHSLLASVVPFTEVILTNGVIDESALDAAVEGRKDIIKYGAVICANEAKHYSGRMNNLCRELRSISKAPGNEYRIAEICEELFSDTNPIAWAQSYGGDLWTRFARTIKKLVELDAKLASIGEVNKRKYEPYKDPKTETKKEILILLNVVDGLMHNTGDMMDKMVAEEDDFIAGLNGGTANFKNEMARHNKIRQLADSKELTNPGHTYEEILPTLREENLYSRYEDYHPLLNKKRKFTPEDRDSKMLDLFRIRFRKLAANDIISLRKSLKGFESLKHGQHHVASNDVIFRVSYALQNLLSYVNDMEATHLKSILDIKARMKSLNKEFNDVWSDVADQLADSESDADVKAICAPLARETAKIVEFVDSI